MRLLNGEKLVLLDEIILNVGDYIDNHPGGKQLIEHNIGRDISKFFYGGYSLGKSSFDYTHSSLAEKIAMNLKIAKLSYESPQTFNARVVQKDLVVQSKIFNITFRMDQPVDGV